MEDFDRELAAAVRAEPSIHFRARVAQCVAEESMAPRWRLWMPTLVVAGAGVALVLGVGAVLLMTGTPRAPQANPRPEATSALADVVPPESPAATAPRTAGASGRPALPAPAPIRPRTHRRPSREPEHNPEVLIAKDELAGVRLLFRAAASGHLSLPPDMVHELTLPKASLDVDAGRGEAQ